MKYKLRYSPAAADDLDRINEYIAAELCSPAAAKNIIGDILDAIETLANFPNIGTPLRAVTDMESDYRFIAVRGYAMPSFTEAPAAASTSTASYTDGAIICAYSSAAKGRPNSAVLPRFLAAS